MHPTILSLPSEYYSTVGKLREPRSANRLVGKEQSALDRQYRGAIDVLDLEERPPRVSRVMGHVLSIGMGGGCSVRSRDYRRKRLLRCITRDYKVLITPINGRSDFPGTPFPSGGVPGYCKILMKYSTV